MLHHVWENRMDPFCVFGNLYFVGTKPASAHLIDTGAGLILLDSGYPETLYLVLDSIRRLGFRLEDLALILHSHGHIDHIGGTRALVELTGAKTAIGAADADTVRGKRDLTFAKELDMRFDGFFEPDLLLGDGDMVEIGSTRISCLHTPGHTEGTMSYFFPVTNAEGRTLRVGTHGGVGMNSMTRGYLLAHGLPLSLREDFRTGLHRLQGETVDIFIGNHQDQCDTIGKYERIRAGESDAFVDPVAWPLYLAECERKLDQMLDEETKSRASQTRS